MQSAAITSIVDGIIDLRPADKDAFASGSFNLNFTAVWDAWAVWMSVAHYILTIAQRAATPFAPRDSENTAVEEHDVKGLEGYLHASAIPDHLPMYRTYRASTPDRLITVEQTQGAPAGCATDSVLGYAPTV
jgi:hypothetical protein